MGAIDTQQQQQQQHHSQVTCPIGVSGGGGGGKTFSIRPTASILRTQSVSHRAVKIELKLITSGGQWWPQ